MVAETEYRLALLITLQADMFHAQSKAKEAVAIAAHIANTRALAAEATGQKEFFEALMVTLEASAEQDDKDTAVVLSCIFDETRATPNTFFSVQSAVAGETEVQARGARTLAPKDRTMKCRFIEQCLELKSKMILVISKCSPRLVSCVKRTVCSIGRAGNQSVSWPVLIGPHSFGWSNILHLIQKKSRVCWHVAYSYY